jgi:hypothetical protein
MLEKSRLEELSAALPERERKELLERISKRMEHEDGEEAVPVELVQAEREKIIAFEMKKAYWWTRFLVWIRTFFSGRKKAEIFLEIRLGQLKSHIRAVSPGLTGFESRDLTSKFARKLWDVYIRFSPILPIFQALFSDKENKASAFASLVESSYESSKKTLEDFISTEEMEQIFAQTGETEEIRKKLSLRMNDYLRGIPESLFVKLEEQARLLVSLGKLALFPFPSFFRYFNSTVDAPQNGYPAFERAPAMLTLDLMERLHMDLLLIGKSAPDYAYVREPLNWLMTKEGTSQEPPAVHDSRLQGQIIELCQKAAEFEKSVPLLDIIRYFRKDPYYNIVFNEPRLYLKSLYFSTLKSRISAELALRIDTIKEEVIKDKIQDILKSQRLLELVHYRENPGFDFAKLGLPVFTHARSLSLTYNYLVLQYKGFIQEAVQVVANAALVGNRITQNRLMQYVSGLEDLEAKIVLFDRSLSADEDDGKQLARFRFNVATDLILQKSYRSFVQQKDREARDLVEKTRECLAGVKKVFDEMRTSTFENTRSLLKTLHMYKGKNQTLQQILNARSEGIGAFLDLMDQLLELEKGV